MVFHEYTYSLFLTCYRSKFRTKTLILSRARLAHTARRLKLAFARACPVSPVRTDGCLFAQRATPEEYLQLDALMPMRLRIGADGPWPSGSQRTRISHR